MDTYDPFTVSFFYWGEKEKKKSCNKLLWCVIKIHSSEGILVFAEIAFQELVPVVKVGE